MYCLWHYVIRIFLICPNKYTVITTTRFENVHHFRINRILSQHHLCSPLAYKLMQNTAFSRTLWLIFALLCGAIKCINAYLRNRSTLN